MEEFISPDTYIGDIIEWPVWSFGKQFNHIHLNILAAGGVYVNGFEFHDGLPDTVGPEIQAIGLLKTDRSIRTTQSKAITACTYEHVI